MVLVGDDGGFYDDHLILNVSDYYSVANQTMHYKLRYRIQGSNSNWTEVSVITTNNTVG